MRLDQENADDLPIIATGLLERLEGAGSVIEVGAGVTQLAVGDTVAWCTQPGSYAQRVSLDPAAVALVPCTLIAFLLHALIERPGMDLRKRWCP